MAEWTGDEWRWRLKAPTSIATITVSDLSEEQRQEREEKVKSGATVVPFGFGRVLAKPREPAEPQLWEGDGA